MKTFCNLIRCTINAQYKFPKCSIKFSIRIFPQCPIFLGAEMKKPTLIIFLGSLAILKLCKIFRASWKTNSPESFWASGFVEFLNFFWQKWIFFSLYNICPRLLSNIEKFLKLLKFFQHPGKYFSGILESAQFFGGENGRKFLSFPKLQNFLHNLDST